MIVRIVAESSVNTAFTITYMNIHEPHKLASARNSLPYVNNLVTSKTSNSNSRERSLLPGLGVDNIDVAVTLA